MSTERNLREAKSNYDLQPTDANVLIKIRYKLHVLGLSADTKNLIKHAGERVVTVEGYGPFTNGIELGDVVLMNKEFKDASPFAVAIPNHKASYGYIKKLFDELTPDERKRVVSRGGHYEVEQFAVVDHYGITGYFKKDSEKGKLLLNLNNKEKPSSKEARSLFNV